MTVIVTGAAGFIGSNIVRALNARGIDKIIAVDDLKDGGKIVNLADCDITHYMDKHDFMRALCEDNLPFKNIKAVIHQGACSDTMEHDGVFMMNNNYQYTLDLFSWCQDKRLPFLYASSAAVYGKGRVFVEKRECEAPLNVYAYSKFLFDQVLRRRMKKGLRAPVAGFRYFNVYGFREQHKGRMASVVFHHFKQYRERGYVQLFGAYDGVEAGMQSRDFVSVEDVVKVNLWFLDRPDLSGIFNLGTGQNRSFRDLAAAAVNACRAAEGREKLDADELVRREIIRYVDFPENLKGKYQSFTRADISALRAAGYRERFLDIEEGVSRYVQALMKNL